MLDRKVTLQSSSQFLNTFRQFSVIKQIDSPDSNFFSPPRSNYQILLSKKKQVFFHQVIFFIFGILFLSLAGIVYFETTNWAYHLIFGSSQFIKILIFFLCLFLAAGAFAIARIAHHEKKLFKPFTCDAKIYSFQLKAAISAASKLRASTIKDEPIWLIWAHL